MNKPFFPAPKPYAYGGDRNHPFHNVDRIQGAVNVVAREGQPSFNPRDYQVVSDKAKNVSVAYLYDYYDYATTGGTIFTFFGRSQNSTGLTPADTNMQQPGNVGAGVYFVVEHIWVDFLPGATPITAGAEATLAATNQLVDYWKVMAGKAYTQFFVNQVPQIGYGISPLKYAAAPVVIDCDAGVGAGVSAIQAITPKTINGGYNTSVLPFMLDESMSFSATIQFPTAITVSTLSRIGMVLKGYQVRQAG